MKWRSGKGRRKEMIRGKGKKRKGGEKKSGKGERERKKGRKGRKRRGMLGRLASRGREAGEEKKV